MATTAAPTDVRPARESRRRGLLQRFHAARVAARMREAEYVVRRARRSLGERGVIDAEFLGAAPSASDKSSRGL